jgi:hypothetical protein
VGSTLAGSSGGVPLSMLNSLYYSDIDSLRDGKARI